MDSKLFQVRACLSTSSGPVPSSTRLPQRTLLLLKVALVDAGCRLVTALWLTSPGRGREAMVMGVVGVTFHIWVFSPILGIYLTGERLMWPMQSSHMIRIRLDLVVVVSCASIKQDLGNSATPLALLMTEVCSVFLCNMFTFHSQ